MANTTYRDFEYKKTYTFDLKSDVKFGPLSDKVLNELFSDGRTASFFVERCVPLWFPKITFASSKGYDFINSSEPMDSNKRFIDQKTFTKRGGNFAPSTMIGAGRKIDEAAFRAHASHTSYCFTDITDFAEKRIIRICFWTGSDLIAEFGKNKISRTMKNKLFP